MSGLIAPVKDGKIVETTSQTSLKKASKSGDMNKEAFLQLLVAQMKYQDPLEPTSNTEYISQYTQFSQVEQMQNMSATAELGRATSLVGKDVYIKTASTSGEAKTVYGRVDYVVFENGKPYLAINESLYSMDDLNTVVDEEYKNAFDKATAFTKAVKNLPVPSGIDLTYGDTIDKLVVLYGEMTEYEKGFLESDTVDRLAKYVERVKELRTQAEEEGKTGGTEADKKTEGEAGASGTEADKKAEGEAGASGTETAGGSGEA